MFKPVLADRCLIDLQHRRSSKTCLVSVWTSEGEYAIPILTAHDSILDPIHTTTASKHSTRI